MSTDELCRWCLFKAVCWNCHGCETHCKAPEPWRRTPEQGLFALSEAARRALEEGEEA